MTERLLHGVLLLKAVALALREVPELNGFWIDGRAVRSEHVNVGVAVSLGGGGLVAPALRDADRTPLDELMRQFQDLSGSSVGRSPRHRRPSRCSSTRWTAR